MPTYRYHTVYDPRFEGWDGAGGECLVRRILYPELYRRKKEFRDWLTERRYNEPDRRPGIFHASPKLRRMREAAEKFDSYQF